ncbi:MAG: hypothetical protein V4503_08090 [Gemmatimonadota bacterium]
MRTLTPGIETPVSTDTSSRFLEKLQAEVLEEIKAQSSPDQLGPKRNFAPDRWLGAALATWLTVIGLVVFRPAIVAPPASEPFAPPAAEREASLRYGVWLARGAVQRFVASNGRLPSFLAETGFADAAIELRATGERTYELVGTEGSTVVTLASGESSDAFLGSSLSTLRVE